MSEATAGVEEEQHAAGPHRASGWLACATVVGVAVLVTAAVVGWARLGGTSSRRPPGPQPLEEEEVPTELAGGIELGDVPPKVAGAFDGPVVGARILDEAPAGADCDLGHEFDGEPEIETVLVTPDIAQVSMVGPASGFGPPGDDRAPPRMRATCRVRWEHSRWVGDGGGMSPADQPLGGMTGSSCCDAQGLGTAEATVVAPDGADWAVQARGGYHLAYPVTDSGVVPVSWRFRPARGAFGAFGDDMGSGATQVTFVDAAGEVIGEVVVRS